MADSYCIVSTKLRGFAESVFFVNAPLGSRRPEVSIPWSLIHGSDETKIQRAMIGQEITFRLLEWKANQLGFV